MRKGIGVSPGVVVGVAHRVESVLGSIEPQVLDSSSRIPAEIELFDRAVADSSVELEAFVQKVAQELGDNAAEIFKGHLQIVNDPALLSKVHDLIENKHWTALSSLQAVMHSYAAQFARIERAGHENYRHLEQRRAVLAPSGEGVWQAEFIPRERDHR